MIIKSKYFMVENHSICVYCKSQNSEKLYSTKDIFEDTFHIHKCRKCKAYFLSPQPTNEQLARAYDDSYYGEKDEKFESSSVENVLDFFRKKRAKKLSKYLKEGANVLDIGCGNGRFLLYLQKYGKYRLNGTELDGNSAKRAAKHSEINLKIGFLEKSDFDKNSLDAVTLFHVFEHLSNPKETLETISELLKKDGILLISFPNIDSYQSRKFKGDWLHLDPPRHLLFFEPTDFIKLLKEYGFEIVSENYLSSEQNPYGMTQSLLNKFLKKREVLFELLKGNTDYAKEYSKFSILMQKLFFAVSFPVFIVTDIFMSWMKKGATVEFTFRKID
ncbi:MAG: class I SAM-dependent methyltransferase [Bacteroidetes bacterium]|nr:class I SAM-dependent methyltransferase [Bacteroidota bacterium]MBT7491074.1 class I SAM-dependent methyltransferase [Bacteroidota bacterium]